ncbi:MAG: protein kinase domain-containing protein [Aureispira sp.]
MDKRRSRNNEGRYLLQHAKEWIQLSETPFAGGGEGNLYHILSPAKYQKKYVAKIYHPHKLTEERARKIDYLSTYAPQSEEGNNHSPVVWCTDVLLDKTTFVGFIMPYTKGEKLEILCTPKIPRKQRETWRRFDFKQGEDPLNYRLRLGFNLCAAIHQVHKMERYVLVDMKPDNIVIQPNGLVSIVDTDSVEVVENNETLFDAPVATPEYTPPEHYQELSYDPTQRQEWDLFGLGVILYKLFFGIHPFAASTKAPYEHLTTLAQKVEKGFFVHDPKHANSFSIVPPPHEAFHNLEEELQALFMRCFVEGQEQPEMRPTAEEWCAALLLATDDKAAYERYGHILKRQTGARRVYMTLPSNKFKAPPIDKSVKALQLLERETGRIPTTPSLSPSQYITFRETLKYKPFHAIIAAAIAMGTIAFGAPLVAVVIIGIFLGQMQEEFKKTREYKSLQRDNAFLRKARKKQEYIKSRTAKNKRRLKRRLGKTARHVENLLKLIKKETQELKDFLKQQDEKVKHLNEEANKNYRLINEEFLQQAKSHRSVARVEVDQYQSLSQIKAALQIEQKKAVQELSRRHADQYENEAYHQEKIAIEQLFNQRRHKVEKKREEEKGRLQTAKKITLNQLHQKLEREANLSTQWARFWNGLTANNHSNKTLQNRFQEAGLRSMLQVAQVDLNDNYIVLGNGQKILLNGISGSKQILRNMLYWMDEIRHQKDQLAKEDQDLSKAIQMSLDDIEKDERIEIRQLEQTKQQQLQQVKVLVPVEQLGAPYEQLQARYESANSYVEELEEAYEVEEKNVSNQFQVQYEDLMAQSEQKAAYAKRQIAQLQQKLQDQKKRLQHKKVQRGLRELEKYERELEAATQDVEIYLGKVERYKKITFKHYLQLLVKTKRK